MCSDLHIPFPTHPSHDILVRLIAIKKCSIKRKWVLTSGTDLIQLQMCHFFLLFRASKYVLFSEKYKIMQTDYIGKAIHSC